MTEYIRFPTRVQNSFPSDDQACGRQYADSSGKGFSSKMPCVWILIFALIFPPLIPPALATAENDQPSPGSLEQVRKLADQGNAEAQYKMGRFFEEGLTGPTEDYKMAVKWYLKAAENGHAQAQYKMGIMYTLGKGVYKDPIEAAKWFGKAAQRGYEPVKQQIQDTGTKLKDQILKDTLGVFQRKLGG